MPRKPRRADWGSVTQVDSKTWRIRYWANGPDGYKRRSKTVTGSRKDAYDQLAALRLEHSQDAPVPTVGDCWRRWYLPDMERREESGEVARQTMEQYRSIWRKHVEPTWASVPVDAVKPLAVQQWIAALPYSAARASLPLFRRVMDYAVRYERIGSNPLDVKYLMPPKQTSDTRDDGVWTPDELMDVWRVCHGTPFEPIVLLCGFGSCRFGEALDVRRRDVSSMDVDGITVACAVIDSQIDGRGRVTESTKNRWSTRTIVLAGRPAERLLELADAADDRLVDDGTGRPMRQNLTRDCFVETLAAAGVPVHPPKNLRKTWQTIARWTLRLPPWLTERMMGHVGEGVTGRHYDRPETAEFAHALADAWRANPFGDDAPFLASQARPK